MITSYQVTDRLCKNGNFELPKDYDLFAFDNTTNILYCAVETGNILIIDCNTNTIIDQIPSSSGYNELPYQNRLIFDEISHTLVHYYNCSGQDTAVLSAYSTSTTEPELKYSVQLAGDDKIYDMILHFNIDIPETRWLLFSTEAGNIKYINCFDIEYDPSEAYIAVNEHKASGFCKSIDPSDLQPEILCGVYHYAISHHIRILKIFLHEETQEPNVSEINFQLNILRAKIII